MITFSLDTVFLRSFLTFFVLLERKGPGFSQGEGMSDRKQRRARREGDKERMIGNTGLQ